MTPKLTTTPYPTDDDARAVWLLEAAAEALAHAAARLADTNRSELRNAADALLGDVEALKKQSASFVDDRAEEELEAAGYRCDRSNGEAVLWRYSEQVRGYLWDGVFPSFADAAKARLGGER